MQIAISFLCSFDQGSKFGLWSHCQTQHIFTLVHHTVTWCTQHFCWDTQHVGWNGKNVLHPNNINKITILSIRPSSCCSCFYGHRMHPSSSCSYSYDHHWPIHLLLPLPTVFFCHFLFVFLFLRCFFFMSPSVFIIVPCGSSSSSASRVSMILVL